ncbi:helix-turn-helix domain-containing protein [Devosia sp.]|uniref:helix-turn-helix domain-containing protein n=1 Tax=Devosia sp. TaxID=1871048 RepID=UPI003A8E1B08
MRAPIGIRISSRRRVLKISQAELARRIGISASYLNLIERNKRDVGGAILMRIAEQLAVDIGELTGESEHKLVHDLEEAFSDPVLAQLEMPDTTPHDLVAAQPDAARAIVALHRAYQVASASADSFANRLRSDPMFSQLLHQILSGITAVRSSAEILEDVPDLDEAERKRFLGSITRDTMGLSDVAQTLIGQFDRTSETRRSVSPVRELDDLILEENNHFPMLENAATRLRSEISDQGPFGEPALKAALAQRFGVHVTVSSARAVDAVGFPGQYRYDPNTREMWFQSTAIAATRQFQLSRLYAELAAPELLAQATAANQLSSATARRLARRAFGSYLAGAIVFPYDAFLETAETQRYDVMALAQIYTASFEQVAHRLVTLRRPGSEGVPFGFLRSDPAGRLTKHFPLPGLLLPSAGHACPLWAIYGAFRSGGALVRQVARFPDDSRYLFIAQASARRVAHFGEQIAPTSIMLACDALDADRTVYGDDLDLTTEHGDVPVGPTCRLCTRRDCASRQEEMINPGGEPAAIRAPLVPGESG